MEKTQFLSRASVVSFGIFLFPLFLTSETQGAWTQISSGWSHSCAVSDRGEATCWGDGQTGALGRERGPQPMSQPGRVDAPGVLFSKISVGEHFSCGLTSVGSILCWGAGSVGELGTGKRTFSSVPTLIKGASHLVFSDVSSGDRHVCGVTTLGRIYCWGLNSHGQLGRSPGVFALFENVMMSILDRLTGAEDSLPLSMPKPIGDRDHYFTNVSSGKKYTCALTDQGQVYCWGLGREGQLGTGVSPDIALPSLVPVPDGVRFSRISTGSRKACGVTLQGQAYCWGADAEGEAPYGPTLLGLPPNKNVSQLSVGGTHSCLTTTDGQTYCWGKPSEVLGGSVHLDAFTVVQTPGGLSLTQISSGSGYSCGITTAGEGVCWGLNHRGRLGHHREDGFPAIVGEDFTPNEGAELQKTTAHAAFAGSDAEELIRLFLQRLASNQWLNSYTENGKEVSIIDPPKQNREGTYLYTITDPLFAAQYRLKVGEEYYAEEFSEIQTKAVKDILESGKTPFPFVMKETDEPNPEFEEEKLSRKEAEILKGIQSEIDAKIAFLPQPNPDHLAPQTYGDHRVGVVSNSYDRKTFLQILLAIKTQDRNLFVFEMANLGTSFPLNHTLAKNAFLHVFSHLYVTGKFPSVAIKKTYYHSLLRCGQIYNESPNPNPHS